MVQKAQLKGKVHFEQYRNNEKIGEFEWHNGIVDEGLNKLLDVMFAGDTPITTWYIGLINQSGFSALNNGDTLSSHTGWGEFTAYDGDRKEWDEDGASSRTLTNTTPAEFTISGSGAIRGVFVTSAESGDSGVLWATSAFPSQISVLESDVIRIVYTLSG